MLLHSNAELAFGPLASGGEDLRGQTDWSLTGDQPSGKH
jgi:hypothetical protein